MILLMHILIALSSIVASGVAALAPTRIKLSLTYGLIGATLASGTYLVVSHPVHLTRTCLTGLVYLGVVMVGTLAAERSLARQAARANRPNV